MSQDDLLKSIKSRTSSPSLSERVRSLTTLRSRVPSTARAASTDGADTETDANVDSDDGFVPPERIRSDPGIYRDEQIVQYLDSTQPLAERVKVVERLSKEVQLHQVPSIVTTWRCINDFSAPDAPPEARRAVFALAQESAVHLDLTTEARELIFSAVLRPIDSQYLELQTRCLRLLTHKGRALDVVAQNLVTYIIVTMEKQCEALFETRRRYKSSVSDRRKGQLPEERGLYSLLSLARDVMENNPQTLSSNDQAVVLDRVLDIAEKTTSKEDMRRAVGVLEAFVQSFNVPDSHTSQIVEILCAISSAISGLSDDIRDLLLRILQTDQQTSVVKLLLQTLALSPQDRHTHTVCGALYVLRFLVENKGDRNLPMVSFMSFTESFWHVHFASRRIRRDCLRTIASLLEEPNLIDDILHSNWQYLIETILTATGDEIYVPDQAQPLSIRQQTSVDQQSVSPTSEDRAAADEIFELLKQIAASFNPLWPRLSHDQRLLVARFHHELRFVLPSDSIGNLILAMAQSGSLSPDSEGWEDSQDFLVRKILLGKHVDPEIYCLALSTLGHRVSESPSDAVISHYWAIAMTLLEDFPVSQRGWRAAGELAKLVTQFWRSSSPPKTHEFITLFKPLFHAEPDVEFEVDPDGTTRSTAQLKLGKVTEAIVDLFLEKLGQDSKPVVTQLYLLLVHEVALDKEVSAAVRLPALRLLIRLRSDRFGAVLVTKDADTLSLAAALNRTEATMPTPRTRNDRASVAVDNTDFRKSRTSAYNASVSNNKGSAQRSSIGHSKVVPKAPLWMYPGSPALPRSPSHHPSSVIWREGTEDPDDPPLKISEWLLVIIQILQEESDWEVYSYLIVHLPSQLCNLTLCSLSMPVLKHLRRVIVGQLREGTFHEPPADTSVKKGDVALCLVHSLVILLGYSELFEDRTELDDMVRALLAVVGEWEGSTKTCIQALTICCHVLPSAVSKRLPEILQKLSQIITQSQLAMDVLDFLGNLARLPHLYADFREDDFRMVFAICIKYLEHSREQRHKLVSYSSTGRDRSANRASEVSTRSSSTADSGHNADPHKDLPQYVFALAYHVLTIWFLSLKLVDRHKHVGWITKNLAWFDEDGVERIEEQSQVTLDMMLRATYTNLNETTQNPDFARAGVQKSSWLVGLSIVTVETVVETGLTQLTKRQASGTTHSIYQPNTSPLPPHHVPPPDHLFDSPHRSLALPNVFPNHVFLQLSATAAPTPSPMEPINLPEDDTVTRALASFDRNDTVDGYKVAVIYLGNGECGELEILGRTMHSPAFQNFLDGLGTRVELKGAAFNTQGLDKVGDSDGTHTYAWRDRVIEIVYHIPTLMPTNLNDDYHCVNKKRHIGNDYVKIIFNESGLPFKFDTFPSQFNFINIVITPENRLLPDPPSHIPKTEVDPTKATDTVQHYTVQLQFQASLPQMSPAASMKMVPRTALSALVRQLALSSSVFCNVWSNRGDGEYVSSWRNRLREITRLRDRYANSGTSTSVKYPGAKGHRTYAAGDAFAGRVHMGGIAEEEGVSVGLDFSRWAGAPPSFG